MTTLVHARRRAVVQGTFTRSMLAAAARGLGLVAAAVAVGVILLDVTEDVSAPPPAADLLAGDQETTTTTSEGLGLDAARRPNTEVSVLVLNGARIEGAAGEVTTRLQALGYATLAPGNAPPDPETLVLFKPGFEAEAAALAPQVSDQALVEKLGDPSPYAGTEQADLVVFLGTNYAGASGTTSTTG